MGYANVVETGESFEALSSGLQNALWQAGGCPREHRADSLSAAFKNLQEEEDFTVRYAALLEHYGMTGTRNNRGQGHENGSVESSHRYLKEAVDQALMLRGHRDFDDRAAYNEFLREVVMRLNRRNAAASRIEREQLADLPMRRTTDFVEKEARVTRCSTFTVRGIGKATRGFVKTDGLDEQRDKGLKQVSVQGPRQWRASQSVEHAVAGNSTGSSASRPCDAGRWRDHAYWCPRIAGMLGSVRRWAASETRPRHLLGRRMSLQL